MPGTDKDPLSQVHDALWAMLESDPQWCALVAAGNRIKFSGPGASPRKDVERESDRPSIRIVASQVSLRLNVNTSQSEAVVRFEVQVGTSEQGFDASLFPVLWQTFRALHGYRETIMAIAWSGQKPVVNVQSQPAAIGVSQLDSDRGLLWWSAVFACEITMHVAARLMRVETGD